MDQIKIGNSLGPKFVGANECLYIIESGGFEEENNVSLWSKSFLVSAGLQISINLLNCSKLVCFFW